MRLKYIYRTGIFNLIIQLLFLVTMYLWGYETRLGSDQSLRFILLATMALLSGFIWVWFFYLQDRKEPEPIPYILTSFVAGMAAWTLFAHPLTNIIYQINEWIHASILLFIQGSFFVRGMIFSLLLFALIRFVFMPLKEFNETVDGMVYGAVIGAGYAVAMVIQNIWNHPDYTLFAIAYIITTRVLIHSAVGSLMGYLIGQAKFKKQNFHLSAALAVTIGILLVGTYYIITELLFISGFTHTFWLSFFFVLIYTLLILGFCVFQMKRLTAKKSKRPRHSRFQFRPLMIVYTIGLLVTGSVISHYGYRGVQYANSEHGIFFRYPHSLSSYSFRGISENLIITPGNTETLFRRINSRYPHFEFSLEVKKEVKGIDNNQLISTVSIPKTESYQVQDVVINEKKGKRIIYSFLQTPQNKSIEFPSLFKAINDIIPVKNRIFILSLISPCGEFEDALVQYKKIVSSLYWKKKG
ncbi:MAG: PrsW family intramembrane metalloprotease [Candidatus Aminicenantes bacterium]|nr:PrsW family intramembrane metalloprotease [Candidatus Aminicenantes bacterium]